GKARRLIAKLARFCDRLPSSFFITGVSGLEEHSPFCGGFGDVFRACYGGSTVALKRMRIPIGSDVAKKLRAEALGWKNLRHPHILPLLGIDRDSFPSSVSLVSPWMENGNILSYLEPSEQRHANVERLLDEIAHGLQYLHFHNIVHGDLRGSNILINEDSRACLADFGISSL
ncbi:kinase-like domain-containing protein, partial [Mycena leptocephala]